MQRILKNIVNTLTEAEDDLFPGFTSSAFAEHEKFKTAAVSVDSINQTINRLKITGEAAMKRALSVKKTIHMMYSWSNHHPPLDSLTNQPWIDKYPLTKKKLSATVIDTTNPNLEKRVAAHEAILERDAAITVKVKKLKSKLLRVRKKESENLIKATSASVPEKQINPNTMPYRFNVEFRNKWHPTLKKETYENPYFVTGTGSNVFAGHPAHFKGWAGKLRTMYYEMSKLIKRLGFPELDLMYANDPVDGPDFYLTNSDNSVIIANKKKMINVYLKDPKDPKKPFMHFPTRTTSPYFLKDIETMLL